MSLTAQPPNLTVRQRDRGIIQPNMKLSRVSRYANTITPMIQLKIILELLI